MYPGAGAWAHNVYPGAGAWVHKCVPRRRGLPSPGAGAWVHNVYAGAGAWVHILAPFAPSVTRLNTNRLLACTYYQNGSQLMVIHHIHDIWDQRGESPFINFWVALLE